MSKTTSKQKYLQLIEWLGTLKKTPGKSPAKKESRLSYYKRKNA